MESKSAEILMIIPLLNTDHLLASKLTIPADLEHIRTLLFYPLSIKVDKILLHLSLLRGILHLL